MLLTRPIKVKPDDAAEILATENRQIYSERDSRVAEVSVHLTRGTRGTAF